MHTLHVTYKPDGRGHVRAVKAVREASKYLNITLDVTSAKQVADLARDQGHALVGESDSVLSMQRAAHEIASVSGGTLVAHVDVVETDLPHFESPEETVGDGDASTAQEDRLPLPKGYDLAIVLMGNAKGVAINAMEAAISLKRVTEDPLYDEALRALARAYPFIGDVLKQNDMWPA